MREAKNQQMQLGEVDISAIRINPKSRDDIPQILRGLQLLYTNVAIRETLFTALEQVIPSQVNKSTGRPGMMLWRIFVLGVLRLNLNCDYDRLHNLANNHRTIREMLGHSDFYKHEYQLQTLKDNVKLLTPKVLEEINHIVVLAGHDLLKKKENAKLAARCDSFVTKTDVHFPTDINLLFDASRKVIGLVAQLCSQFNINSWRQYRHNVKTIKKLYRKAQQSKKGNKKDEAKRLSQIQDAHKSYIDLAEVFFDKAKQTIKHIESNESLSMIDTVRVAEVNDYLKHGARQIDQIRRRVLQGEKIPHGEKVFSLFEPHTEWICKGKQGVPVELGVRVCIIEDKDQFILHHKIMYKQTDDKVAVAMAEEAKQKFPNLYSVSYDRGFYSKDNREQLSKALESVALPKKGKLSKSDKIIQRDENYLQAKDKHSAVESAINGLNRHGLDRCLDHGDAGFERYVALSIVARNIQRIGSILQKREQRLLILRERKQKLKAA